MTYQEKINSIYEGWKGWVKRNPERERLAIQRAEVCARCSNSKILTKFICIKCGCIIPAKVRSKNEKCPLKLW